jgi:hypothetical protein
LTAADDTALSSIFFDAAPRLMKYRRRYAARLHFAAEIISSIFFMSFRRQLPALRHAFRHLFSPCCQPLRCRDYFRRLPPPPIVFMPRELRYAIIALMAVLLRCRFEEPSADSQRYSAASEPLMLGTEL